MKSSDVAQQGRNDLMAAADTERSAWKEIVLDIRNDQGVVGRQNLYWQCVCISIEQEFYLVSRKRLLCMIRSNVQLNIDN